MILHLKPRFYCNAIKIEIIFTKECVFGAKFPISNITQKYFLKNYSCSNTLNVYTLTFPYDSFILILS